MKELKNIILLNIKRYPKIEIPDVVCLIYQNEFGPAAQIKDRKSSLEQLVDEWDKTNHTASVALPYGAYEDIGGGLCRANLAAFSLEHLPLLNQTMLNTAESIKGNQQNFVKKVWELREFCGTNKAAFSEKKIAAFLQQYERRDFPAPRHSPEYFKTYAPAYRVVSLYEISRVMYSD